MPDTAAIAEAAAYLDGMLKPGLDPETIAAEIMRTSQGPDEATGRWHLEVPSRWTRDGNPLPFSVSWQDDPQPRYAIIDHTTGYIFGVLNETDPEAACRTLDEDIGAEVAGRSYETVQEIGPGETGYHVYEMPADFPPVPHTAALVAAIDGRDEAEIDRVQACGRLVAHVRTTAV